MAPLPVRCSALRASSSAPQSVMECSTSDTQVIDITGTTDIAISFLIALVEKSISANIVSMGRRRPAGAGYSIAMT